LVGGTILVHISTHTGITCQIFKTPVAVNENAVNYSTFLKFVFIFEGITKSLNL